MRKVDENHEGAAFEETLFSMKLASKGLAWAENVLQKLEHVNLEDIIPKNPSKYVDAVGEHLRKVCEDVADDWLNSFSDGCLKVPVSDLSLEHEVITEICGKSKLDRKQCLTTRKSGSVTALGTGSFSEANGYLALGMSTQVESQNSDPVDVPESGSLEYAYDTGQKSSELSTVSLFPHDSNVDQESDPEDNLRSEVWCASISSSTSIDTSYQSVPAENGLGEQGDRSFASSSGNVWYDPDKQLSNTPIDIQDAFVAVKADEILDGSDTDETDFLMIDAPDDVNSELIGDAILDESWAKLEQDNHVIVADRHWQSSSFRRRIKNAFRSKKDTKTTIESLDAQSWCEIKHPNSAHDMRTIKAAVSKENITRVSIPTKISREPEWEVL